MTLNLDYFKKKFKALDKKFDWFKNTSIGSYILSGKSFYSILGLLITSLLLQFGALFYGEKLASYIEEQINNSEGYNKAFWYFIDFIAPSGNWVSIIFICLILPFIFWIRNKELSSNQKKFVPTISWLSEKINLSIKDIGRRYIILTKEKYKNLHIETKTDHIFDYFNHLVILNEFKRAIKSQFSYYDYFYEDIQDADTAPSYEEAKDRCESYLGTDYYHERLSFKKEDIKIEKFSESIELTRIITLTKNIIRSLELNDVNSVREYINELKPLLKLILKEIELRVVLHEVSDLRHESDTYDYDLFTIASSSNSSEILLEFLESEKLKIYLNESILLTGEALTGKTHALCHYAKKRIIKELPTVLCFGHMFNDIDTPIKQIIKQLDLDSYNLTENEFIKILDDYGKKLNTFVLIIIDAINETDNKQIWINNFRSFVLRINNYTNLRLVLSVRDVEMSTVLNTENEEFICNNMALVEHNLSIVNEVETIEKFCNIFNIEIPRFPLVTNIFQNPGLVFLFFETLEKRSITQITQDILRPNFIIEEFVNDVNKRFKKRYKDSDINREYVIQTTNIASEYMSNNDFKENIEYEKIISPTTNIHEGILQYLISEGIFISHHKNIIGKILRFSYQKFGNYFIALYILYKYYDLNYDNKKIKETLLSDDNISKLDELNDNHAAIVEAIFTLLLEKFDIDIMDVFTNFKQNKKLMNLRLNSFINSQKVTENILKYISDIKSLEQNEKEYYLEIIVANSFKKGNDIDFYQIVHKVLLDESIIFRDSWWSIYINNSFINKEIVHRLVDWAYKKPSNFYLDKEYLLLYGTILSWFLTSSNRELRDKTTKALVNIFTDNINCFLDILKEFSSVNDLYISERIYAVAYGITLRSNNQNSYKELAEYIYNNIFNVDSIVEHIMIRDYAKLTVEYIYSLIKLDIEIDKVKPPYNSVLPDILPSDEEIDSYENKNIEVDRIISSMVTESGRSGRFGYGDFGRYTFQSSLRSFKLDNLRIQNLSNYAVKIIIDEIIEDAELFSQTESNLKNISHSRNEHKIERIGKKYQWLAFYKILAIVADNFKVKDDSSWNDDSVIEYKCTSQLSCRDIDPTSILRNKIESEYQWWLDINNNFENLNLSDTEWMKSNEKLPIVSQIVHISFEDNKYLLLDTSFSIDGNKENYKYRNLYYHINSFILKKEDLYTFVSWAKDQVFYARRMPEANSFYSVFLREYPFSESYNLINNYYNSQMNWETTFDDSDDGLPCEVLLTSTSYMNEASGYDNSVDNSINIKLPNKWIIENMNLKQSLNDGEWIDVNDNIVFIDKGSNDEDGALLVNKEKLLEFLNNNGYTICWIMWGEKQVRNSNNKFDNQDFLGISEIDSFSYFDGNEIIDSEINVKFESH